MIIIMRMIFKALKRLLTGHFYYSWFKILSALNVNFGIAVLLPKFFMTVSSLKSGNVFSISISTTSLILSFLLQIYKLLTNYFLY